MYNNTATVSHLPQRDPTEAELDRDWALSILANLPCAGEGCETVDQQIAAAQVHATLALASRVDEGNLINRDVLTTLGQIQSELEGLRCDGIAVVQA